MPTVRVDGLKALVGTAAAALVLLALGLALLVSRIDRQSAQYEAKLVRSGFAAMIGSRLRQVESEAIWDELLQHTQGRVDAHWLDTNVASPSDWDTFGAIVTIVGPAGTLAFAREQARGLPPARAAAVEQALAPLIARLRAREAATVRQRTHPGPPTLADRISLAATVILSGQAYAALACRIDSATGDAARPGSRAPILAVLTAINDRVLPAMTKNLLLAGAALTIGAQPAGLASISLDDEEGRPVATLAWAPLRPGTDLLRGALPGILIIVAALGSAMALAYRRGTSSALALRVSEERARHLAFHDQLTELPNRRFLTDRVAQAVAEARRHDGSVALLLIDLDRFKAVNDLYGHAVGDELIVEVALRLIRICRRPDLCARLGGDEFVILATDCSPDEAILIAERVTACIAAPIQLSVGTVQIGASIGMSIHPDLASDEHELLRQADLALHRAKEAGHEKFCFHDAAMDEALQQRLGLESDLRDALRRGEISVAYQPQFRNGVMTGCEALARWIHPKRGPVSPASFIPLAETCGLIDELGFQILAQAFTDGERWPRLSVAVNLSAVQIRNPDFLPRLERLVADTAISTERYELEITETVLMADDSGIPQTLESLRAMGFRLALDDFGTGYSSLSYLRRFPLDKIKIDRSFVTPLPADKVSLSLVRTIVDLAHALDLDVIAEGVETPGQRDSLSSVGCETIQGYLTGRPVPAAEIDRLLTAASPHAQTAPACA